MTFGKTFEFSMTFAKSNAFSVTFSKGNQVKAKSVSFVTFGKTFEFSATFAKSSKFSVFFFILFLLKGKYKKIAIVNTTGIDKAKVTSHNK